MSKKNNEGKNINIQIAHGRLEQFTVYLNEEGKKDISASIGLYTHQGKKVTSYCIDTRSYYENTIDFPISTFPAIQKIAEEIELSAIRHCREGQQSLPESNNNEF